jgi:hypothetical protein
LNCVAFQVKISGFLANLFFLTTWGGWFVALRFDLVCGAGDGDKIDDTLSFGSGT